MSESRTAQGVRTLGLVGARGHTGSELVRLMAKHPRLRLAYACSRGLAGEPVCEHVEHAPESLRFLDADPALVGEQDADVVVLAMPNGATHEYVEAIEATRPGTVLVDISADYRFTDDWVYGLPERNAASLRGATRISNPGCYATAMQLATLPVLDLLAGTPPVYFGVSGYSGAGSTPSPKNDPDVLRDNLLPYSLAGHMHEREVGRQLGRTVRFMPHVAPFFRGLSVTCCLELAAPATLPELVARYEAFYADAPLVETWGERAPTARDASGTNLGIVGGITLGEGGRRLSVVGAIDNLLKGAASQAVQNLNLALGFDAMEGLA